ncbi:hypothetical protein N7510_005592 [Penicillium lagena]|uniref:uncharacterized protein n=1 Tax=Penicillium lagena TaxID=94218 RepID=UPI00254199FE|nr:uncharacterized protein N7510_005592 [Penicillium lagena]KAJ5612398.1 hypothetical protein N7510_005592 [Penicillium lagena]
MLSPSPPDSEREHLTTESNRMKLYILCMRHVTQCLGLEILFPASRSFNGPTEMRTTICRHGIIPTRPLLVTTRSGLSIAPRTGHRSSSSSANREPIIFSGIQPTGVPHLGNYLGALRQWVKLQQDADPQTKLFFSIVDLHALTVPQNPDQLRRWRTEAFATLLAVGLDPKRSTIFYQSAVVELTPVQSKLQLPEDTTLDHSAARQQLRLGLFSYPVLQAADILVHRATHVPVGEDQKQHLEFSRYTANSFNHLYGPIFPIPEAVICESASLRPNQVHY